MEKIENSIERLSEAKTHLVDLTTKKSSFDAETKRLEGLLMATQGEVDACIKERRGFIEGGGDVFDPRAKRLRKQEQENSALIDDLMFAIETNRKASGAMGLDLYYAHNKATAAIGAYTKSLASQLVAKVLENPPVELLKACHIETMMAFQDPGHLDEKALFQVYRETITYKIMFTEKIKKMFFVSLAELVDKQANEQLFSDEEKSLFALQKPAGVMSPAQAHFFKSTLNQKNG